MHIIRALVLACSVATLSCACSSLKANTSLFQKTANKDTLVVYYSRTHSTKSLALAIAAKQESEICQIDTHEPYPDDFEKVAARVEQNRKQGVLPEITKCRQDISKYRYIILGSPLWFGEPSDPVQAFLKNNDLNDKVIIPFVTYHSGGYENYGQTLEQMLPESADVIDFEAFRFDPVMSDKENTRFFRYMDRLDDLTD